MYYPYVWYAKNTPSLDKGPTKFAFFEPPIPEEHCQEDAPANPVGCRYGGLRFTQWFTNYTFIAGEPTMPEEMLDKWVTPRQSKNKPWTAPGTSPVTGNGCGVNGGNQYGCGLGLFTFQNASFSSNDKDY